MQTIYSTGKVCRPGQPGGNNNECLELEPDLGDLMAHSRDYDELEWAWKGWRDAVGPKIGELYPTYVELKNEAATLAGRLRHSPGFLILCLIYLVVPQITPYVKSGASGGERAVAPATQMVWF